MILPILLSCIAVAYACQNNSTECCTCLKIDSICYNASFLFTLDAPFRNTIVITKLGILHSKNTIYYAFEPNINDIEYYKIGFVDLDNHNISGIVGGSKPVYNFMTFDIDQENNIVYAGGSDGLYYLDSSNKAAFFSSGGDTITNIFYKSNVFFIRYGDYNIVEKVGNEFRGYLIYKNVKNFVIDKNNVLVFQNNTGLYANKFKTNNTVHLSKNAFFRGLTIDLDSTVYAWWIDGIYKVVIDKEFHKSRIVKIAKLSGIGAMTFDNHNNFLITIGKNMIQLSATDFTSCLDNIEN